MGDSLTILKFGRFQVHPHRRELLMEGTPVRLGDRAFDILLMLIEARGELVSKEALMARVWPGIVVEDINLSVQISALRKALEAERDCLKTVSGRGFRFVAAVTPGVAGNADAGQSSDAALPATPRIARTNLPEPTSDLIGRDADLKEILALAADCRLVTLTGAGGIGKTRLGVEAARQLLPGFADGVWLAELAPLTDPRLVPAAVASALGLTLSSGTLSAERVAAALGSRQVMLILDNCEHLIDAAAEMAEALLRASPVIRLMATSREPLRADGEAIYHVPPLGVPGNDDDTSVEVLRHGAVQLFIARARAAESQFSSGKSIAAMAAICRHLDGIPLAIELAAARVAALGVEGLAARLHDRFKLLTGGHRTALPRHQTLQATLDWSYDLLPAHERVVLRRLAVFSGNFTLESASAVAASAEIPIPDVVDYVVNLVAKSLITADVGSAIAQYRLLETMRAYALEKLAQSGELDTFAGRHAQHYRALFERAAAERETRPTSEWIAEYGRHLGNARLALDWAFGAGGDAETGIALTMAAAPFWTHLSLMEECRMRVEQALSTPDAKRGARVDMQLYAALGMALLYTRGPVSEISATWNRVLGIADSLGDADYRQRALWGLWVDELTSGNFPASLSFARKFSAQAGNTADLAVGDRMAGISLLYLGELAQSRSHIERMLGSYVAPDHGAHVTRFLFDQRVMARMTLSQILWLQGFPDQAMRTSESNIANARAINHAISLCNALGQAACPIALLAGDYAAAERYLDLLLETMSRHVLGNWYGFSQCFKGVLMIKRGEVDAGARNLRAALDEFPRSGWALRYTAFAWDSEFADVLSRAGDIGQAMTAASEALARSERMGEHWCLAELLRTRGELLLRENGPDAGRTAEGLFRQGLDLAARQGALSWELRCATSLARLWRERGRGDEARDLLAPVYARFTEGFATSDLIAAKALLDRP